MGGGGGQSHFHAAHHLVHDHLQRWFVAHLRGRIGVAVGHNTVGTDRGAGGCARGDSLLHSDRLIMQQCMLPTLTPTHTHTYIETYTLYTHTHTHMRAHAASGSKNEI